MRRSDRLSISRRELIAGAATAAAGFVTLPAFAQATGDGKEVTYASRGGVNAEVQRESLFDPFTQQTGIIVNTATHPTLAQVQAMVTNNTVDIDLFDVSSREIGFLVSKGLLEPINYSLLDPKLPQEVMPGGAQEHAVASYLTGIGILYSNKAFTVEKHPRSWRDFFDVEAFPGMRVMGDVVDTPTPIEIALIADGVSPDELYPLDFDRAFKKLDALRPHVVKFGGAFDVMMQENAVLAQTSFGRTITTKAAGGAQHIEVERNEAFGNSYYWVIPKGAKNLENAHKVIDFATTPENTANRINAYPVYGPVVPAAMQLIKPENMAQMINAPGNNLIYLKNDDWWSQPDPSGKTNYEVVLERWAQWLG